MSRNFLLISPKLMKIIPISSPKIPNYTYKSLFLQLFSSNYPNIPTPRFQFVHFLSSHTSPNPNPNFPIAEFSTICSALRNSNFPINLEEVEIEPSPPLLRAIFKRFNSSPKRVFSLFKWAEKRPGYDHTAQIFNSMLNMIAKSGQFKWSLMILINEVKKFDGSNLISADSLGILIVNYARLGMPLHAVRVFELGTSLNIDVFGVLLDGLCKYGHVRVACDYVDRKMGSDPNWVVSIDVYNVLLEGWFRVRDLRQVERVRLQVKRDNSVVGVATYGVVVEGYCRMGLVDRAMEVLGEMRREGVTPNRKVYDPLVRELAEKGRFKEALGMLERFWILESGPTLTTYNSLVRGFCKAGDIDNAGKILRMMTSRGIVPTPIIYNHFFRYFAKNGKVDEGLDLYRKMIDSGYEPDEKTFHLMLNMLYEDERFESVLEIRKDMRCREYGLDLDTSTMLISTFCKMRKFEEAVTEFEGLIEQGFIPNRSCYQILQNELKKNRLLELASRLSNMMTDISCSKPFRSASDGVGVSSYQRRKSIMSKAKAMSDILKTSSDPKDTAKLRKSSKMALARQQVL